MANSSFAIDRINIIKHRNFLANSDGNGQLLIFFVVSILQATINYGGLETSIVNIVINGSNSLHQSNI